jgi:hypothetical protein
MQQDRAGGLMGINQDSIETLLQHGIASFRSEEYLNAFLSFERALALQPENALLWNWRGQALTKMNYGHLDARREQLPPQYADTWMAGRDVFALARHLQQQ